MLKSLFCAFSEGEIEARKGDHYAVLRAIDEIKERHKGELRPHKQRVKSLVEAIEEGGEKRQVECSWRDSLVEGGPRELVRDDTGEVVESSRGESSDPEIDDERQPGLFGSVSAAPLVPILGAHIVDREGECHAVNAEKLDDLERLFAIANGAEFDVRFGDGPTIHALKLVRGRACGTCGIVGHHRPECPGMMAEDAVEALGITDVTLEESDDYDRNDTAAVARKIAEGPKPDDRPLTRGVESATAKPKRGKKSGDASEVQ